MRPRRQGEVPPLAGDPREREEPEDHSSRHHDVEPRHHEEVVEPASPVRRDHPAIQLGRAPEDQRAQGAADVSLERVSALAHRRQPAGQPPVGNSQHREERARSPLDLERALCREAVSRPGKRDLAVRRRKILREDPSDHLHAVAAVRREPRVGLAGDEQEDVRRKAPPSPAGEEPFDAETAPRAGRLTAPEVREDAFHVVHALAVVGQRAPDRFGLARRRRDPRGTADEAHRQPQHGKSDQAAARGSLARHAEDERHDGKSHEHDRLAQSHPGPGAGEDSGDEARGGRDRRRPGPAEHRADHWRRNATSASTRCVSGNMS